MLNKIYISSGSLKGRKITFSDEKTLRPTASRSREKLFNYLRYEIAGKSVLDLYAGSGALGIESISLGAESVTFCEKSNKISREIVNNLNSYKVDNFKMHNIDAIEYLQQAKKKFDIIFIDPPFHKKLAQKSLDLIIKNNILNINSYVYIETEHEVDLNFHNLQIFRKNKTKSTKSYLLKS